MRNGRQFFRQGFSLTEVMIALAIVAVIIPVVLALVVNAGETTRQAEQETLAVLSARTIFEEIRRAKSGSSELIKSSDLKWGTGETATQVAGSTGGSNVEEEEDRSGDWLLLLLDRKGKILEVTKNMAYKDRYMGDNPDVTVLAAVRGYSVEVPGQNAGSRVVVPQFRLELRIETPARALPKKRSREIFIKSDSKR